MTPRGRVVDSPAVLWIHSGGMIVGSPQVEAFATGRIARELDVVVVSPEYRLAPECPFPAALDDCVATLRWMRVNAGRLGIDPDRIAVMGASAGGGLAASLTQRCRDEGIALRAQVLVYPMLDDRSVLKSAHEGRGVFIWTPASNRLGWTSYLGRPPRDADAPQYAAPARRSDLTGLPPAWIGVGDLDLFHPEAVSYAESLMSNGVACTLVCVDGRYHGADVLVPNSDAIRRFQRGILTHLRAHLFA